MSLKKQPLTVERKTMFSVGGKCFPTETQAIDYAVNATIAEELDQAGYKLHEQTLDAEDVTFIIDLVTAVTTITASRTAALKC